MEIPYDDKITILKQSGLFSSFNEALADLYKDEICADATVVLIHECGKSREEIKHEYIWHYIDTLSDKSDDVSNTSHTTDSTKAGISTDAISSSSVYDDSDYGHLQDDEYY